MFGSLLLVFSLTLHAQDAAPAPAGASVSAVSGVLILHTSVSSKSTKVGQVVKASTKKAVTLPDGQVLPRGTNFLGTVTAVSPHTKDKPVGAILLTFDKADIKGKDPINMVVRISGLAPEDEGDSSAKADLPNNGGMVSKAGNSGGKQELHAQANDHTNLDMKTTNATGIDGVYLSQTATAPGVAYAKGEDVYLDSNIEITVMMGVVPAK